MVIHQGEVYWIELGEPGAEGLAYRHPHVVVQNDLFNRSRIGTVVVCALTSNLRRAAVPGNVLLDDGEANLPTRSAVNVSQLYTVDKTELREQIGALSAEHLGEVLAGIHLVLEPRDVPPS